MFGYVAGCGVDAADNRPEWDIIFVNFRESIYALSPFTRIKAVVSESVDAVNLLQFMKAVDNLLVAGWGGGLA